MAGETGKENGAVRSYGAALGMAAYGCAWKISAKKLTTMVISWEWDESFNDEDDL